MQTQEFPWVCSHGHGSGATCSPPHDNDNETQTPNAARNPTPDNTQTNRWHKNVRRAGTFPPLTPISAHQVEFPSRAGWEELAQQSICWTDTKHATGLGQKSETIDSCGTRSQNTTTQDADTRNTRNTKQERYVSTNSYFKQRRI